jgi:phospholipase C
MNRLIVVAGLVLAAWLAAPASAAATGPAPDTATPIRHLVVLMQSNHSFDNYFGTYPGADGIPADTCLAPRLDRPNAESCVRPFHLGNQPVPTLDHGLSTWKRQYDNGLMDGTVAAYRAIGLGTNSAMGYYDARDLPYYWAVARNYVLFDRFFSSARVGSRLNRFWWITGRSTPGGLETLPAHGYKDIPTIFDRLEAAGVSWKFYVQSYHKEVNYRSHIHGKYSGQTARVPLVDFPRFIHDSRLAAHIVDLSQYYIDLARGRLPAVAFIASSQSSENPPGSVQVGQRLVRRLTTALVMNQVWRSSAFMWTYDGWGGWYDHVRPPKGHGFRVPALLMSPYAKRGQVNHTVLDYTSILRFIESNWHLQPLAVRDAHSPGLNSAFNFTARPRPARLVGVTFTSDVSGRRSSPVVMAIYLAAIAFAAGMVAWSWLTRVKEEEVSGR